jgi:hypothetical protein
MNVRCVNVLFYIPLNMAWHIDVFRNSYYILDVDECANAGSHNCSSITSTCQNKDGGFSCTCKTGYMQKNLYECKGQLENLHVIRKSKNGILVSYVNFALWLEFASNLDFDECEANTDGCSQICSNVNGSYDCDCHFGFSLNDDRKTCSKGEMNYMHRCCNISANLF